MLDFGTRHSDYRNVPRTTGSSVFPAPVVKLGRNFNRDAQQRDFTKRRLLSVQGTDRIAFYLDYTDFPFGCLRADGLACLARMSAVRNLHLLLQQFVFSLLSASITKGHSTGRPDVPLATEGSSYGGGLHSVLQDSVSPAFGATIIIIVTVIVSGSAYLCFLKYVCAGCCKPTQVAPVPNTNPNKSEEQV